VKKKEELSKRSGGVFSLEGEKERKGKKESEVKLSEKKEENGNE